MADDTYWFKQSADKPLFPDLLWSRPENKRAAGKLLIIGGQAQNFHAPAAAYSAAQKAGAGTARVLMPDSTKKHIAKIFPEAEFAPSAPSGSFGRTALDNFMELAGWADGVLLAGDFGKNSETAIVLESFADKYDGQLTLTGDALEYFITEPRLVTDRAETLLAADFGQLQKLAGNYGLQEPIKSSMDLLQLARLLHDWSAEMPAGVLTEFGKKAVVAWQGSVSTTEIAQAEVLIPDLAARAAVWWLQQPSKPFEAVTTAIVG